MIRVSVIGLTALLIFFYSCNSEIKSIPNFVRRSKLDSTLMLVLRKFPNYKTNAITRQIATDTLTNIINRLLPENLFSEYSLKVLSVHANPQDTNYIIQFYKDDDADDTLSAESVFDVLYFCSDSVAKSINENYEYFIYGHNYKRINKKDSFDYIKLLWSDPQPDIIYNTSHHQFVLGCFMCEGDSIIVANNIR